MKAQESSQINVDGQLVSTWIGPLPCGAHVVSGTPDIDIKPIYKKLHSRTGECGKLKELNIREKNVEIQLEKVIWEVTYKLKL